MTDQKPCSCGGSNENCVRCYGRGFIECVQVLAPRFKVISRKRNAAADSLLNASPSRVPESMVPIHSGAATKSSMKRCPLCDDKVREDRLQSHMSIRCSLRPNKPNMHSRGSNQRIQAESIKGNGVGQVRVKTQQRKKTKTKAARKNKRFGGRNKYTVPLSSEEMQRIFESKMVSGGRFGSSRRH